MGSTNQIRSEWKLFDSTCACVCLFLHYRWDLLCDCRAVKTTLNFFIINKQKLLELSIRVARIEKNLMEIITLSFGRYRHCESREENSSRMNVELEWSFYNKLILPNEHSMSLIHRKSDTLEKSGSRIIKVSLYSRDSLHFSLNKSPDRLNSKFRHNLKNFNCLSEKNWNKKHKNCEGH